MKTIVSLLGVLFFSCFGLLAQIYQTNNAIIDFVSAAPLEVITARSSNCQGVLNVEDGEFIFRVFIKTFEGFNNPLQQIHFYENYLEVTEYPESVFKGYIVEPLSLDGKSSTIRAKGEFEIHGVVNERIIDVKLKPTSEGIHFQSEFSISLDDYDIGIPNIVNQKISNSIDIIVSGQLQRK